MLSVLSGAKTHAKLSSREAKRVLSVLSGGKKRAKVPSWDPKMRAKVPSTVVRTRYMRPVFSFHPCPSESLCTPLVQSEVKVADI